MDWDDLRFALAVARAGSIAGAARALGVAHTTVYRRVSAFEETSGVRFFDRGTGSYVMTEAGRELLELGTELEARVVAFERRLGGRDLRLDGDVTVATMDALALELAALLHGFRRSQPGIRVSLHVTTAFVDLARREADIAVRATSAPGDSLVGRKVADLAFAVYTARSYRGPLDFATGDWVCFDDSRQKTPQARWEAEHVPPERVVFRTNSRVVFFEAVASGGGLGILPCGLAARAPNLIAVTEILPSLTMPLWLLTHADLAQMPRVRAVLDFLGDALARDRPLLEGAAVVRGR